MTSAIWLIGPSIALLNNAVHNFIFMRIGILLFVDKFMEEGIVLDNLVDFIEVILAGKEDVSSLLGSRYNLLAHLVELDRMCFRSLELAKHLGVDKAVSSAHALLWHSDQRAALFRNSACSFWVISSMRSLWKFLLSSLLLYVSDQTAGKYSDANRQNIEVD